uniref:Methyltransferase n=1 Tax=Mimivirus LCMiAC02 TaxID=2506609 RepID=A0A481Z274_9VIRU|nr:MAG: methyltransferase [Mimivirus LCMiAC02]
MNNILAKYYLDNKREFIAEAGHNILLKKIKKYIGITDDEKGKKILGIDVGCNVGNYIKNIEDICQNKNREILCFEPNPVNLSILKPKIQKKAYVKLYEFCLSNTNSQASLYNWKNSKKNIGGNGLAGLRSGGKKICDIPVYRLDNILDNYNDFIIKFIKIDTEGNDTNVIKGMGDYLYKTKYIIFECSDCLDDIRGPGTKNPMKDIVDYLDNYGFDTYRIGTKKLFKVNGEYWNDIYEKVKFWSNAFAIKKEDKLIEKIIDENFNYL